MRGLLEKDVRLICMKGSFLMIVPIVIFLLLFTDGTFVVTYLAAFGVALAISTISFDERDDGLAYLMTLPVDLRLYVREKYLFCQVVVTVAWGIALVLMCAVAAIMGRPISVAEELSSAGFVIPAMMIVIAGMIPLQLKFGAEKSRIVLFLFIGAFVCVIYVGNQLSKHNGEMFGAIAECFRQMPLGGAYAAVFGVGIAVMLLSASASLRIMKQKEL